MADWYCRISGEEQGPLTASQLRTMVDEGRLTPGDALRQGSSGVWVPAASVKGLFGGSGKTGGAVRPAATHVGPGPRERPRPLLRALPMEDEPASSHPVPPPSSLLDGNDAGLDLTKRPELPDEPSGRAKGWRSTGLDFLAEAPPIPPGGVKSQPDAGKRRRRDAAEPIRRWTLPVLAGTLVFLLVVWIVVSQLRRVGSSGEAAKDVASVPKTLALKESAAPKTTAKTAGPPPKPGQRGASEPAGVVWLDASRQPWKCDDPNVTVTVRAAAIGPAKAVDADKRAADTQDDCLLVWIELVNHSTTRKIQYTSWNVRGTKLQLTDDLKNPYNLQTPPAGMIFEGQQRTKSVYPEKTVEDLLVFERPVDRAKSLRLQLPAAAFEGTGTGHIEIPMSIVKSAHGPAFKPPPPLSAAKAAGAMGADKKSDGPRATSPEKPPASAGGEAALPAPTGVPEADFGIKASDAPQHPNPPPAKRGPPPPPRPSVKGPPPAPKATAN